MPGSFSADSDSEYLYSDVSADSSQTFASSPQASSHNNSTKVRASLSKELLKHQNFDQPNVFKRLGIDQIDSALVDGWFKTLQFSEKFVKNKKTLQALVRKAEGAPNVTEAQAGETGNQGEAEEAEEAEEMEEDKKVKKKKGPKKGPKKVKKENEMRKPLYEIFEEIRKLSGGAAYPRQLLSFDEVVLRGEGDTFSFPELRPDLTIYDDSDESDEESVLDIDRNVWRLRGSFIEMKATSKQGPLLSDAGKVTEIVAQAADYARLHLSARPFQLFSIGLLVFGSRFRVAIFDRDGVELSPVANMWDDNGLRIFIRVVRRLFCEMSIYELGMDPNVTLLELDHPVSVACRQFSQENKDVTTPPESYPTYAIKMKNVTYFTIGYPIWSSLSLMGRGTNVWRVTTSRTLEGIRSSLFILKSQWRRDGRLGESMLQEHVKSLISRHKALVKVGKPDPLARGSPEGLVEFVDGMDVTLADGRLLTTANLRNILGNHLENTTVLHRIMFRSIGRPIWEFDSFLEFFLGIRAALAGHEFLASQGVLHRDVSAGNILLSLEPNAPAERRGFLTDFEFARLDGVVEVQKDIAVPRIPNPDRGGTLTPLSTRTHTTFTSVKRGAAMTGTVQFMAYALVVAMVSNKDVKHEIHHDVESFIWVIYYATLRRLGYVNRPLQGINLNMSNQIVEDVNSGFKDLFGHTDLKSIRKARFLVSARETLFGEPLSEQLNPPLVQFFDDLERHLNVDVRYNTSGSTNRRGQVTYQGLYALLDKVIGELRTLPQ